MVFIKSINVLVSPILACFSQQKRTVQVLIFQYFLSLVQNEIGGSGSTWKRQTKTGNRYHLATLWGDADGHIFQRQNCQHNSLYPSEFRRWNKTESVVQVRLGNEKRRPGIVTLWQHSGATRRRAQFSASELSAQVVISQ